MTQQDHTKEALSIGAVSQATGIGVETLRMWERRYGAPQSIRLPSGHRRYPLAEVERLRAVAEAMKLGYRAREVASAPLSQLLQMVERSRKLQQTIPDKVETEEEREIRETMDRWIEATVNYNDLALSDELYREWAALGPIRFLNERIMPFMERLGDGWMNGDLAVSHEHFGSEKVNDFLASMWRRQNERNQKSPFLIASLPGDLHRIGLQMCALIASMTEHRVIFIGPQTPPREIIRAAQEFKPAAVCLSISATMDQKLVVPVLEQIREELPKSISIVAGGKGAPKDLDGTIRITDFQEFFDWARKR